MNKTIPYKNAIGYAFASAAIAIFIIFYLKFQPQIIAGNGFGWDGIEYHKYYEFFGGSGLSKVNYPFCSRVGLPFLASGIGLESEFLSFKIVNMAFAAIFSITTYSIARHHDFTWWYSLIALFLSANLFFSPIRFLNFYPVYTDPAFLALTALALLSFLKKHYLLSFLIIVTAQPIREAAVFVLIFFSAAAIYTEGLSKNLLYKILISLGAIFAIKFGINIFYNCQGSQLRTAIAYLHTRLTDPVSFVNYIAAILMTAAPVFFCKPSEMTKIKVIYTAGFIFAAGLSFVGGSDATRIFFSFFPIYFVLIIDALKKQGYIFSMACLLGYFITNRVSRKILEPLNYWPAKDESGLFFQFPDHARPEVGLVIIVVWAFIFYLYGKIFPKKSTTSS